MPEEFGDRTEQPTDRRRDDARRKGNVARSTDLTAAGLMLAAAFVIWLITPSATRSLGNVLAAYLSEPLLVNEDAGAVVAHFRSLAGAAAGVVLPVFLVTAGAALFLNLGQVGFLLAPEALEPKLERLNPFAGLRRILSVRALMKLAVSLGKLLVVVAIAGWCLWAVLPDLVGLVGVEWFEGVGASGFRERAAAAGVYDRIHSASATLAFQLAGALFVLALADFAFQRWKHEQDLRMTKQEIREEMKQMEGDPHIRQRRREAHRKLAQARELRRVPEADVVITNPTHIAVALKYDPEKSHAPVVLAKGMGEIAERIRRVAVEHGIPIIERRELARALYRQVAVGRAIPVDMYEAFVEIMAYVYRLTGKTPPTLAA
ncbi:MAG: EscU/YscU/HrcU family type III secretion system export apparatus switch protein [Planctomycetes bacterium]|nr:EscU/YscU/HrcU family type III secretion system export apparatus switch protein [Planctomycetota bacterium]